MIKVIYDRNATKLTVEGHADSGEVGHDLVCASVSILVYTLASFAKNTHKARQIKKLKIRLDAGDAEVSFKAKRKYKAAITLVCDAICAGFEILARNYPENLSYEIKF
ncbi:MAG: ribosomal-processing cysteine protease Prp [Eubacteriales bacterium]